MPLPKRHHEVHNLCAIIYDQLTEILADPFYSEMSNYSIDLSGIKNIEDLNDGKIHLYDLLDENGKHDQLELVLTKHITMSILGDFVNFIYESLSCARRGKMPVAYSLLRKPLIDELLIFEQILTDRTDFINRFYHNGEPNQYDPSEKTLKRELIIGKAIDKIPRNEYYDKEIIYALRYDKSISNGINGISNKALHIVTKDKNYKTEDQELNFIFVQHEDYQEFWDHYYTFVPYLLLYSVAVIDEIVFSFLNNENHNSHKSVKEFKRFVITLIYSKKGKNIKKSQLKKMYEALASGLSLTCSKCKTLKVLHEEDFLLFVHIENFICEKCFCTLIDKKSIKTFETFVNSSM